MQVRSTIYRGVRTIQLQIIILPSHYLLGSYSIQIFVGRDTDTVGD